eukprot:scaffold41383_cov63-Phaeocystis_antarctica.AAC.5
MSIVDRKRDAPPRGEGPTADIRTHDSHMAHGAGGVGVVGGCTERAVAERGRALHTARRVDTPTTTQHCTALHPTTAPQHPPPPSLRGGLLPVALGGRLRANVTQQRLGLVALLP